MAKLALTMEIGAPPDRVAVFFVPQRMPYWYGAEMESQFEVQGGAADFAAGQKVQITGHLGKKEVSLTVVVTDFEFGRVLEWRLSDPFEGRGPHRWGAGPPPNPP